MYNDDVNAKLQAAEKAYYGDKCSAPTDPYPQATSNLGAAQQAGTRSPYSLQEEAARRAQSLFEQASKAQSAALFLAQNPAFEDFIRLVRQGAIQF
jgi:hypothetical protein